MTFWPDLARLGMQELEEDIVEVMIKRVYDMCGIFNGEVKVVLDG